ncbi:DDE-type integrase/transposase/recombinase [Streptomyces sp. SID8366]|uniref:Mu transposase C-terminal domain-containing protein n=1 Tax=unclassified Streptomyces TaxID=2593676 RepID=UPI000DB9F523|nr:Mu transposase C-terminal domain-containing protein [Streptomyces sp. PsTaAH-130]MYU06060.1 DDE-type integrase/transposase/recombinase [Streptomyces sp. SID8366]MYU68020.1 DDE-type integrase/transposase/recombinase [Streptomyces sp. SID69]RAJ64124.1 Mu transposase-like protein [Streptomyces sp. PsTaAH-130]
MNEWTTSLRTGLPIAYDGEQFTVAEIEGRRILLRQTGVVGAPKLRQVDISALLAHPSTEILVAAPAEEAAPAAVLCGLTDDEDDELTQKVRHVQEVLTGYRLGDAVLALDGEPREDYAPGTPMLHRYAAKAAELKVGESTIRRWITAFRTAGPAGLVHDRPARSVVERADARWVEMARSVLDKRVKSSRPVRNLILAEIAERLVKEYGKGTVPLPGRTTGYELLKQLAKGTNAFEGSTKGKRSIANAPQGTYGRLRATRPGEYVVLDTTPLDVFAMEPVTCRWVRCELTVAMDLYSRCIVGLRLTPVSTKSVDVAGVLFETVRPREGPEAGPLPYCGVPSTVVLDAEKLVDRDGQPLLPSVAAETIVFDHGKIYMSKHIQSVCAKFRISLQPARPMTPTDKPVERWFRTISQGLLAALPGYKGSDVYSRGESVEDEAYFFIDELEMIIREWITLVYHQRHHRGLCVPEVPGLKLSPLEMFEHGVTRAGPLRIPARPHLALEFLEEVRTTIQHYGVEVEGLRYNGDGLNDYRNQPSPYRGVEAGKWPITVDPGDITKVYFQDPKSRKWHVLDWEHGPAVNGPVSREALVYARKLAKRTHRFPDTQRALIELLDRWGVGLTRDGTERRMALRLSQQRLRLVGEDDAPADEDVTAALPSLRRLAEAGGPGAPTAEEVACPALHVIDDVAVPPGGDDDESDEIDAAFPGDDIKVVPDEEDYYADVWETR